VGAARDIAAMLRAAADNRGTANVAFSGGSNAQPMLEALAAEDVPWARAHVYQVDERVAPDAHPDRNAVILQSALLDKVAIPESNVHLMPVAEPDLEGAAPAYGASLPRFDVLHMGIGEDGHTASWPPGDPVIDVRHQRVAIVGPFNGRLRMTITPAVVDTAHDIVFLVTGASKRPALERMLAGDPTIPATHVPGERTVVHADRDAYGG
jgi:6-phosphogluconolactonase